MAIDPKFKIDENNSSIRSIIRAHGIYDRRDLDWYNKFKRFDFVDPYNALTTTKEYIFFTKPDLNLLTSSGDLNPVLKSYSFFQDAYQRYKPLMEQLQYSYSASKGPFVNILSNCVTSGLDLPGVSADKIETSDNVYGIHQSYRWHSIKSDHDHEFSLEFEDTKYLEVYMLFKIYDEYENLKSMGIVKPKTEHIMKKVIHDQMSVYKIVVGEDGMSIKFYAKITGVFPLGRNRDAFSDMNNNDGQKLSMSFFGHTVKDNDPSILFSFNSAIVQSKIAAKNDLPLYDREGKHANGEWSSCPYIAWNKYPVSDKEKMGKYYLLWKE